MSTEIIDTNKILVYSDIHYHSYHNGLTIDDVEAVDEEAYRLMKLHNVDFWIFLGDRFASRNPLDDCRQRADKALKRKNDYGKPGLVLVGNHDQWLKSGRGGHTLGSVNIFKGDLNNIHVFDTAHSFVFPVRDQKVVVHGIPAGHTIPDFTFDNDTDWNIGIFHDMIIGSKYQNGNVVTEGIPTQTLDSFEYDLVLGGDNHKHQELPFVNVP